MYNFYFLGCLINSCFESINKNPDHITKVNFKDLSTGNQKSLNISQRNTENGN